MADEIQDATGKTTGFLKKKAGPLEVWQWLAAAGGLLFAYLAYRNHQNNAAGGPSSAPATATDLSGTGAAPTDLGSTISGQLTNLTGQVGALQNTVAGLSAPSAPAATPAASTGNVISDLQSTFGGGTDTASTSFWNQYLGSNTVGQTEAAYEAAAGANQLNAGSFNPQGFVSAQYQTALGRSPDAAGLASWEGQLTQGGAVTAQNIQAESSAFNAAAANENKTLSQKG